MSTQSCIQLASILAKHQGLTLEHHPEISQNLPAELTALLPRFSVLILD